MNLSTAVIASVILVGVAGCSSPPPASSSLPRGALASGTAHLTIDGKDAGTTHDVNCRADGLLMNIATGNDKAGARALLDQTGPLAATSVSINNVGGFTGSYEHGLNGSAEAKMNGQTYVIDGTADGFGTDSPSFRTSKTFEIKVAC